MKSKTDYSNRQQRNLKLIITLTRALQAINKKEIEIIEKADITMGQFGVLEIIYHKGPLMISEITEKTLSTGGNITVVIDNLEKSGLAERIDNKEDRRSKKVTLTKKGKTLMRKLFPQHLENLENILSALSIEEKNQIIDLNKKLGKSITNLGDNMQQPTIAAKKPAIIDLKAGTYYWCACGKSSNQPFCDGSHEGTAFSPVEFTLDKDKKAALCQCKHTKKQPFCDGAHSKL